MDKKNKRFVNIGNIILIFLFSSVFLAIPYLNGKMNFQEFLLCISILILTFIIIRGFDKWVEPNLAKKIGKNKIAIFFVKLIPIIIIFSILILFDVLIVKPDFTSYNYIWLVCLFDSSKL